MVETPQIPTSGRLRMHLLEAKMEKAVGGILGARMDPYVTIKIGKTQLFKSTVCKDANSLQPTWIGGADQFFDIDVNQIHDVIRCEIMDKEMIKDKVAAYCDINEPNSKFAPCKIDAFLVPEGARAWLPLWRDSKKSGRVRNGFIHFRSEWISSNGSTTKPPVSDGVTFTIFTEEVKGMRKSQASDRGLGDMFQTFQP